MLTDMLDTPVSKLAMGKNVNLCQYLLDSRTLRGRQYGLSSHNNIGRDEWNMKA